jgi:hypothetical protein
MKELVMPVYHRKVWIVFVAAALAVGGMQAARAQTVIPFANTSSAADFNGLFVSISGCSYTINNAGGNSCTGDGLEPEQVAAGRGNVELEILPTSGTTLLSAATGGLSGVQYTLALSTNEPSTAKFSSYALASSGVNTNGTANNFYNTVSGYSEVVASIAQNASVSTCTQSGYGTTPTISCLQALTPVSSLSISGGLLISGATNSGFSLNATSFLFRTVP